MGRAATTIISALALAVLLAAPAAARPSPPTAAEIERATERFLERHPDRSHPPRPRAGPAVTASLAIDRVVALYGAPQMSKTILGLKSPDGAARKLERQARPYAELGERPVVGAFDLVSVFATAGGGSDGLYRARQDPGVIQIYLDRARLSGARLILDIQPGRSSFIDELRELREWLLQPDVDVALDPEWNVGPRGVPGRTQGKVSARKVNAVTRYLARLVRENDLPPKLLLVHQFRQGSIRGRNKIRQRDGVQTILNFDGIGSPAPKQAGYAALSVPRLFDGFSLFYRRDTPLMRPPTVLGLEPEPEFLLYQ